MQNDMKDIERIDSLFNERLDLVKAMKSLVNELIEKYKRFDLSENDIEEGIYPISVLLFLGYGVEEIRVTSVYKIDGDIVIDGYDCEGEKLDGIYIYDDFEDDILDFIHHVLSSDQ